MLIAASLKRFFDRSYYSYSVCDYTQLPSDALVLNCQVLADNIGELLVVYPNAATFDLAKINQIYKRSFVQLPQININRIFHDCEAGCWLPIGRLYGLSVLLDQSIKQLEYVYFSSGSRAGYIRMQVRDFISLQLRLRINTFIHNQALLAAPVPMLQTSMSAEYSALFTDLPVYLKEILQVVVANSYADAVLQIKQFQSNAPESEFWQHAFAVAAYAEQLAKISDPKLQLDSDLSYLAGLIHNSGMLLLSVAFVPEYRLLQKWLRINPKVSIRQLEQRLLGMGRAFYLVRTGHAELGARLLRYMQVPEPLCIIAAKHHTSGYTGDQENYIKIIQFTNQLLRKQGMGDGEYLIDERLLEPLGLTFEAVKGSILFPI